MRSFSVFVSFALFAFCAVSIVDGCATADRGVEASVGAHPTITTEKQLVPTVNVSTAKGWALGEQPTSAEGTTVNAFASGLEHPRWLYVLPNGDVLVAETNGPKRPDDEKGIKGKLFGLFQAKAGGAAPSANRITLLRDVDGDGVADVRTAFLTGLQSPFGMALVGDRFFVANSDSLVSVSYKKGQTEITEKPAEVTTLPGGPRNHHWTKSLIASKDGKTLFVGVGSNSNAAENGITAEFERAAVWAVDVDSGAHRLFATGLRNPVGMAFEPVTGLLWVAVNERDEIGDVPDYMTSLRDGDFFGFPWSYWGDHVDDRVKPSRPDLVARARRPDYALGAHTASLGLASSTGTTLGRRFAHGMFIGQHGSWNREPRSGYKVVFVEFDDAGAPVGAPVDVVGGFVDKDGNTAGLTPLQFTSKLRCARVGVVGPASSFRRVLGLPCPTTTKRAPSVTVKQHAAKKHTTTMVAIRRLRRAPSTPRSATELASRSLQKSAATAVSPRHEGRRHSARPGAHRAPPKRG